VVAAAILVISVAAFLQFFVSYCRSLIAAYNEVELSEQARQVIGIESHAVSGDDFRRLLELVRVCPEMGDDTREIGAVRTYYSMLGAARALAQSLLPSIAAWMERERAGCTYFVAVALDRRIARNRFLLEQQASGFQ
jgi:hypothetical protein